MSKRMYLIVALLLSSESFGQIGALEGQKMTPENEPALFEASISYAIGRQGQRAVDSSALVKGFVGTDTHVYSLSDKQNLVKTNRDGRLVENHWPLTRWPHEYLEQEVEITYRAGNFVAPGDPNNYLADEAKLTHLMGCMQKTPLRHGDFSGNGSAELVVFLADEVSTDVRLFSLGKQKLIFSSKLNFTDSKSRAEIPDYYLHDAPYQYLSWRHINSNLPAFPATKAYAKLYVGNFNGNEQQDLLVWRKLYQSRRTGDDIKGFELLRETFLHYTLANGEYLPQSTQAATIQGWLSAKQLTWQKGYPSKSECSGEEGKLIPEMHDPLLNDPDVLR